MKYYIIAGEASGDLHGSNLMKQLSRLDANASFRCWGGDMMQTAGGTVVKHYRDLAFMGFAEVIKNLPTIFRNLSFCKKDILENKPEALILIDYPGFNLRIAKWAKQQGIKVIYYISPQVWAWKEGRVKEIRKTVDKMLVILPFEIDFYKKWDYKVEYVGHPLVEVVSDAMHQPVKELEFVVHAPISNENRGIVALLPGSRTQEIGKKLPIMVEAAKRFSDYHFIVAKAPAQSNENYLKHIKDTSNVSLADAGQTYFLLKQAKAALVTSGTATLETALFEIPEVVCYKGSAISYQIAKRLIKVKYISLVNLIMDKEVVKELIQDELTTSNIEAELNSILHDSNRIERMKKDYKNLKRILSEGGNASEKAADIIWSEVV